MRRGFVICLGCALLALAATASEAGARISAPRVQSPGNEASVQSLPAFTWGSVRGAAQYEFEFAADRKFSSGVNGFGQGAIRLNDTAITSDKTIPDGTYYWRVRGVTAKDHAGPWSHTRVLNKAWTSNPTLLSPLSGTVAWPANPLVLRWTAVSRATKYDIWIATDPALSNLIFGSVNSPEWTTGTVAAVSAALTPGTYYWAITPVDAEGNLGHRSTISSFTWTWPSDTSTNDANVATDANLVEPQFSWVAVPAAASYEVEVNSSDSFPVGSKLCCDDHVLGTALSPTHFLPNETTLYWRVRAIDVRGDAGEWNYGPTFRQSFDEVNPSVGGLSLDTLDANGQLTPLNGGSATTTPVVTWNPVPGASSYEIQTTPYSSGCDWTTNVRDESTSTTSWTPLGNGGSNPNPGVWPGPESGDISANGTTYCFRILARQDDGATNGSKIDSNWTYLGGFNNPAFQFEPMPAQNGVPGEMPSSAYALPAAGAMTPRAPLFTWQPVPGANSYYVVIARDQAFTDVIDVGFTSVAAYSPRIPYRDDTAPYWWAIVPAEHANGTGVFTSPEQGQDNPQQFLKSSVPPAPLAPTSGADGGTVPTLRWSSAEGVRNYRVQVAGDPTFSNTLIDVTTDSTAYTVETMLPANRTLYWRVRATDVSGNGLNWSSTASFTHSVPAPSPSPGNPTGGESLPVFSWTPVNGAIGYDIHLVQADGTTKDFNLGGPLLSWQYWYGTGIWRWQVRADFPGGVSSAYFSPQMQFVRVQNPPGGARGTKSGSRIVISWNPDPNARQYRVELSATDGFGSPVASDTTDNSVWVPQVDASTAGRTLYWRVASVDEGGNVGAYDTGVFHAPRPPRGCVRSKHHRCPTRKHK